MSYPDPLATMLVPLCAVHLRVPILAYDKSSDVTTYVFTPSLTTAEQATFAGLQALARATLNLTPEDWTKIDARLPTLRTFRQQTRAQFMALDQTTRDRAIFDTLQDISAVLVVLLRD